MDLDELEALAEKATPGPWIAGKYGVVTEDGSPVVSWDYAWSDDAHEVVDKPFIAACSPDAILALIARLRAAESWADSLALQAHSMATAIDQGDEDGGLDALGPVTAAIIRQDAARTLEIVAERPPQEPPR